MAGHGSPTIEVARSGARVGVVAALWHEEVMAGLVAGAERAAAEAGAEITLVRVPGTFELPVTCARLARRFDALVALGVVVRGGTPHFDYVCSGATQGLTQVMVDTGVPIGFGVLTCDDDAQARDRAGLPGSREDKGYEAMQAALATLAAIREVEQA